MRRCAAIRPLLPRMIRLETDPEETLEARRHLGDCPGCRVRSDRLASIAASGATRDIASMVMDRLRELRESAARAGVTIPAGGRWGTLALVVGSALTALSVAGSVRLSVMSRPLAEIREGLTGGWTESVRDMAQRALPFLARSTHAGMQMDLPAGANPEISLALQFLATGLGIVFMLAIPAGALAAWLLRESRRS